LLDFIDGDLYVAESMANSSALELQDIIGRHDDKNLVGETIFVVATELKKVGSLVPYEKEGLKAIKVDDTVAALLMQQVFGSTELVVGLHARKIVTALDMFDWEETGVTKKGDVKMVKITAERVKKSLKQWMPKGEGRSFHDVMDSLGALIGSDDRGTWGKVKKTISLHFSPKDKKDLDEILLTITQFYKVTKSRRRKCG